MIDRDHAVHGKENIQEKIETKELSIFDKDGNKRMKLENSRIDMYDSKGHPRIEIEFEEETKSSFIMMREKNLATRVGIATLEGQGTSIGLFDENGARVEISSSAEGPVVYLYGKNAKPILKAEVNDNEKDSTAHVTVYDSSGKVVKSLKEEKK